MTFFSKPMRMYGAFAATLVTVVGVAASLILLPVHSNGNAITETKAEIRDLREDFRQTISSLNNLHGVVGEQARDMGAIRGLIAEVKYDVRSLTDSVENIEKAVMQLVERANSDKPTDRSWHFAPGSKVPATLAYDDLVAIAEHSGLIWEDAKVTNQPWSDVFSLTVGDTFKLLKDGTYPTKADLNSRLAKASLVSFVSANRYDKAQQELRGVSPLVVELPEDGFEAWGEKLSDAGVLVDRHAWAAAGYFVVQDDALSAYLWNQTKE